MASVSGTFGTSGGRNLGNTMDAQCRVLSQALFNLVTELPVSFQVRIVLTVTLKAVEFK